MTIKTREEIENIIEDCVIIKVKDIPEHMCNLDLTWLDKEILRIKDRLRGRLIWQLKRKMMWGRTNGNKKRIN